MIQKGVAVIDAAKLPELAGAVEKGLGKRGLSRVDLCENADYKVFHRICGAAAWEWKFIVFLLATCKMTKDRIYCEIESKKGAVSMFQLRPYFPPDFSEERFVTAPEARCLPAPLNGVAPEGYHAMSIFP